MPSFKGRVTESSLEKQLLLIVPIRVGWVVKEATRSIGGGMCHLCAQVRLLVSPFCSSLSVFIF
jgi:hypothetical protein